MANTDLSFIVKVRDEASAAFQRISSSLKNAEDASKNFAKGLAAGGAAVAGIGVMAIKAASEAEQTSVAFTTMLGSAEEAQKFIANMKQFAAKTPFETKDIAQAAQTMLAFGADVKSVMPNIQMIGDVAMGNKEKFASLSLSFSQVQATGRLMGQDLLQMINQGFNPLTIMAQQTGKSMSQLKEEMEDGAISADMVTEAFKIATSEGGRFFGGMEAQSKTLSGAWSTMSDAFNEFLVMQGQRFLPVFNTMVLQITSFIQDTLPKWITKIEETVQWFEKHTTAIYVVAGAIVGAMIPAIYSTIAAFAAMAIALAPFIIGGAVIGGLVAGIVWLVKNWETVEKKADEIWGRITDFIKLHWREILTICTGGLGAIVVLFVDNLEPITNAWNTIWNGVRDYLVAIMDGAKNVILGTINWVIDKINGAIDLANKAIALANKVPGVNVTPIQSIPPVGGARAAGGPVRGGTPYLVGENGPEVFMPNSSGAILPNRGSGGGVSVVVNVGNLWGGNPREAAREIGDMIIKQLQINRRVAT